MTNKRNLASLFVILVIVLVWVSAPQAQATIRARFIHAASEHPSLDIYVNGELTLSGLAAGAASAYLGAPAGANEVRGYLEGSTTQRFADVAALDYDASAVILLSDAGAPVAVIADDLSPLEFGMSRVLLVNALNGGASLGISSPQSELLSNAAVAPGAAIGPIELAAGQFAFSLLSSNGESDVARHDFSAALPAATSSLLVIHGEPDRPQLLHAQAAADAAEASGRVRFVHAVQGAAPVDLSIDDRLIIPGLAFAAPSEHIALPVGSHQLSLSLGETALASFNLDVSEGGMQTVVVIGSPGSLEVHAYHDSLQDLNASSALVNLINAVPNSAVSRLRLDSGAIVAADVAFGEAGGEAQIVPGRQSLAMALDIGDERGTIAAPAASFYAGSYYNLIALAGNAFTAPRLLIAETSLMRRVTASPPPLEAAVEEAADTSPEDATPADAAAAPEEASEPGAASESDVEVNQAGDAKAAFSSESPAADASETPPGPGAGLVAVSPFAVVDLVPSARLQLRQYPSSQALSLGLLPGGTQIIVLGRRGPTEFFPGDTPILPIDMSDYTADPAAALYPVQDLPPADTWLFIMYQTEDGGALVGWVNALYLQVFDETGEEQRLASLPMVRQNRAGSTYNTELRSPELADYISARVYHLDADALLNLRAANNAESEVMTQLAPNAELKLIGLDADDTWVFVDYATDSGELIRGWASAKYIQFFLSGEPVSVNTLRALDEMVAPQIDDGVRGSVRIAPVAPPTPLPPPDDMTQGIVGEIALDPGAMLHLRRGPAANTESLALIPAGTKVMISGITKNNEWLKASYQKVDGWISAHYVALLLRGRLYHRSYVISLLPTHDNSGAPAA